MAKKDATPREKAEAVVKNTSSHHLFIIATWSDATQDIWRVPAKQASKSFRILLEMNKHAVLDKADGEMTGDQHTIYGLLYGESSDWARFKTSVTGAKSFVIDEPSLVYCFQVTC